MRAFTRFRAPILSGAGLPGRAGCARPLDAGPPDGPAPMAIGGAADRAHVAPQGPQVGFPLRACSRPGPKAIRAGTTCGARYAGCPCIAYSAGS